jgi:hypothetical protein
MTRLLLLSEMSGLTAPEPTATAPSAVAEKLWRDT